MATLLLRLVGPMQSWGIQSMFSNRDTTKEPTKSGVIGLLLAAKGVSRDNEEEIAKLAELPMSIRVDQEGTIERDFQTVKDVVKASGTGTKNVISDRFYLADANFLVALEGDYNLLSEYHNALANPKWHTYLGRKAFVPSLPVYIQDGLKDETMDKIIREYLWKGKNRPHSNKLRLITECSSGEGEMRRDVPTSFMERSFGIRYVKTEFIDIK